MPIWPLKLDLIKGTLQYRALHQGNKLVLRKPQVCNYKYAEVGCLQFHNTIYPQVVSGFLRMPYSSFMQIFLDWVIKVTFLLSCCFAFLSLSILKLDKTMSDYWILKTASQPNAKPITGISISSQGVSEIRLGFHVSYLFLFFICQMLNK